MLNQRITESAEQIIARWVKMTRYTWSIFMARPIYVQNLSPREYVWNEIGSQIIKYRAGGPCRELRQKSSTVHRAKVKLDFNLVSCQVTEIHNRHWIFKETWTSSLLMSSLLRPEMTQESDQTLPILKLKGLIYSLWEGL